MADPNPPLPDDKGQTVRINFPTEQEPLGKTTPLTGSESSKGQTVRINTPAPPDTGSVKRETVVIQTPSPAVPKKETTHLHAGIPAGGKPAMPPPPRPPAPPVAPSRPAVPPAASAGEAPKPASPKKETARIQIPPQPKTPAYKATVKLEQPKPTSAAPAPAIAVAPAAAVVAAPPVDSSVGVLSVVVAIASVVAVILSFLAFNA
jgi:hypothetical protein